MYIYANMANLQKCSRCKSEIDISYFGLNRKREPYKTCVNCRSKPKKKSVIGCTALGDIELKVNIIGMANEGKDALLLVPGAEEGKEEQNE